MRGARWLLVVIALALVVAVVQLVRPVPDVRLQVTLPSAFTAKGPAVSVPWPSAGQSALAIEGVGLVGTSGATTPQPIASVAKVMVAYLILKDHPLASGANGPSVTITPADVAVYQSDLAGGQSVVPVVAGETLTERQLLEGLLLPSGNNLATLLGEWDAGSLPAFVAKMNQAAQQLGMTHTHYADASGVSPETTSTAADQMIMAQAAMADPTFRHIVALPQTTLPVAGVVYNVNAFLGRSGIVGIKTGSTLEAGGCFVAAAPVTAGSQTVLAFGAAFGQDGVMPLHDALTAGQGLVVAAGQFVTTDSPVRSGEAVATLVAPWAPPVAVVASSGTTFIAWNGLKGSAGVTKPAALAHSVARGAHIATLQVQLGEQAATIPLTAAGSIPPPSLRWRLTRH